MIKILSLLGIVSVLAYMPSAYAADKGEVEATCKQYAKDDNVPEADMKSFMEECMKELASGESAGESKDDSEKKGEQ